MCLVRFRGSSSDESLGRELQGEVDYNMLREKGINQQSENKQQQRLNQANRTLNWPLRYQVLLISVKRKYKSKKKEFVDTNVQIGQKILKKTLAHDCPTVGTTTPHLSQNKHTNSKRYKGQQNKSKYKGSKQLSTMPG